MPKTLDITRILREQKKQLRAGFQDRLVMTTSISLHAGRYLILHSLFMLRRKHTLLHIQALILYHAKIELSIPNAKKLTANGFIGGLFSFICNICPYF
jgi:hypothetical protein